MDEYGFIPLDEVVEVVQERYDEATDEAVRELVSDSRQHRFEIVDERIRALYGHSFFVEMDGEAMDPPERLYMGTTVSAGRQMKKGGIQPVDRSYLHLSTSYESAESRSRQVGTPCVAEVLAKKAYDEESIEFYERGAVVLTREIPPEFVGEVHGLDQTPSREEPPPSDDASEADADTVDADEAEDVIESRDAGETPDAGKSADAGKPAAESAPKPAAFGRRPRKITGRR